MRKLLTLLFALSFIAPCFALESRPLDAGNVNSNIPARPWRLLNKQFAANANVFCTADPSAGGTPLTETSATGITGSSGTVAVALNAGFTAPVTLTIYYWCRDAVTGANSGWVRLGANAAQYAVAVDTNYATVVFTAPPYTPYIIESGAAITGKVYVNTLRDPLNNNSPTGY